MRKDQSNIFFSNILSNILCVNFFCQITRLIFCSDFQILVFLKGFSEEERRKLAMITALFLANGLISAQSLNSLFEDHLIKEGIGLDFATTMFEQWLKQKDVNHISNALRRVNLDGKLMVS